MRTLTRPVRSIRTPADDVRDDHAVAGVANATGMPPFYLKSHYASPLDKDFRDLAWKTQSDQHTVAYGTCELIIFQCDCTCRQLGVNIVRWLQNIGHAKRVEEPVVYLTVYHTHIHTHTHTHTQRCNSTQ
jgi:hypothetical protein